MRILFVSTPVGPIGSGAGGGVETNLQQLTPLLASRGHEVGVVAPAGSRIDDPRVTVHGVDGVLPTYATNADRRTIAPYDPDGMVERMWARADRVQRDYDVIVGLTYDRWSFDVTSSLRTPVGHVVSLASQIDETDRALGRLLATRHDTIGFCSRAQAATFGVRAVHVDQVLFGGVDTARFGVGRIQPAERLAWVGRISSEKNLADAVAVASAVGMPLDVLGALQEPDELARAIAAHPLADVAYHGFRSQAQVAAVLATCTAMLMTHSWVEAFGNTAIESLATGTPVVAYAVGGPTEVVEDGVSGFLVPAGDVGAMTSAVRAVATLDRRSARARAEQLSLKRFADRYERFCRRVIAASLAGATC
jgi:UDP-glucose:tetrahydrobiopterin glucosyltransferase